MPTPVRKIVISRLSKDPSVVNLVTDTLAHPQPTECTVKILYSGFSGSDINMRMGNYPMQKKAPLGAGYCFVGRVAKVGSNVTEVKEGALVACLTKYDSEATYANQPAKYLMPVPESLAGKLDEVVCLILDWTTAYGMVDRVAKIKKGDKVFIHGLSGAVGYAIMQLCLLRGATIYGTASPSKHAELASFGAKAFTYTNKDWIKQMQGLGGVHAVFDALGSESWEESWQILSLTDPSRLIGYGANAQNLTDDGKDHVGSGSLSSAFATLWPTTKLLMKNGCMSTRHTSFFYVDRDQKTFAPDFQALLDLLEQGKLDIRIKQRMKLEDVQDVHRNWTSIKGIGSCVVEIDGW